MKIQYISARVDGISMHWEISNVWHQPGRLMNLPPVSSAAEGAWCDGRGLRVCCLQKEWEPLKVSDHGNNSGLCVCLWSFFLITDLLPSHLMPQGAKFYMRWASTKCQTLYWVLLVGKVWLFPFYRWRDWDPERGRVLAKVTQLGNESKSVLLLPRLRVSHSQSIHRYSALK